MFEEGDDARIDGLEPACEAVSGFEGRKPQGDGRPGRDILDRERRRAAGEKRRNGVTIVGAAVIERPERARVACCRRGVGEIDDEVAAPRAICLRRLARVEQVGERRLRSAQQHPFEREQRGDPGRPGVVARIETKRDLRVRVKSREPVAQTLVPAQESRSRDDDFNPREVHEAAGVIRRAYWSIMASSG